MKIRTKSKPKMGLVMMSQRNPPPRGASNKRLTQIENAALRLLRKRILLESSSISFTKEQIEAIVKKGPGPYGGDHTGEIRDALRLYTDSWILPLVDALIRGDRQRLGDLMSSYVR